MTDRKCFRCFCFAKFSTYLFSIVFNYFCSQDDNVWVKVSRIQFVGACNPPTDAGRVELSHRFLRHAPLLLVDFPEKDSLLQIYRTFNGGMMKLFPNLRGETDALTEAMVEVYQRNQTKFTPEMQPQYFYSPRELSRWVRGIYEAVANMDQGLTKEELVRIWAHEGLRLFGDRLVEEEDAKWCHDMIDEIAQKWFAGVDFEIALKRPLYYTTWLSKETRKVEREELKEFLAARLVSTFEPVWYDRWERSKKLNASHHVMISPFLSIINSVYSTKKN